jgi:hypothetical protein
MIAGLCARNALAEAEILPQVLPVELSFRPLDGSAIRRASERGGGGRTTRRGGGPMVGLRPSGPAPRPLCQPAESYRISQAEPDLPCGPDQVFGGWIQVV